MQGFILASLVLLLSSPLAWATERYPHFEQTELREGRNLWLANCEGCHGWGVADAPIPMQPDEWRERLQKPQATLYAHAINGFFGPDDSMMPPRGGNAELSDVQVKQAVDYMTTLARYHLQKASD